jgi:hypothetical protein
MRRLSLQRQRQLFGFGLFAVAATSALSFFFWDGIPVWFGPSARAADVEAGRELFEREWAANDPQAHGDGLGPVFNAKSCAACHFQGGVGGGGGLAHNATGYEIHSRPGDDQFHTGTIHAFSTNPAQKESLALVRKTFPVVKGRVIPPPPQPPAPPGHCVYVPQPVIVPDFDPLATDVVQPTALFGAGWIDLISESAIRLNARNRSLKGIANELKLQFDDIPVGRLRVLDDGRVGRFGWKAQFASLDEFVAAACANELGLGNPLKPQVAPLADPNYTSAPDLDKKQFKALNAFVKMLPCPVEDNTGVNADLAKRGKELFNQIGCAACHVPDMGGVKGVYSDFLLYTLDEPPPPGGGGGGSPGGNYDREPPAVLNLPTRPESEPKPSEWRTPPLWGVADSAPYFHDGGSTTLHAAILRHRGDGRTVSDAFKKLPNADQVAIVEFLKTLKAPPTALALKDPNITKLAKR